MAASRASAASPAACCARGAATRPGAWPFAGLIAAPLLWALVAAWPATQIDAGYGTLIAAGLLVGVGTRYGAGCTSGHGVCGLSRLSGRSLVATLCFMAAGFVTVYVLRHLSGA